MAARNAVNKLFVGNLPWTIGHEELFRYFSEFGSISSARVIFDNVTGMSKGYGFVMFNSKGALDNALGKQSHKLEGNKINIQRSTD